jgi:hypothetical protein
MCTRWRNPYTPSTPRLTVSGTRNFPHSRSNRFQYTLPPSATGTEDGFDLARGRPAHCVPLRL